MSDYCELPEFFTEWIPKAKKEHHCCECGNPILKGTLYWKCIGKWDGKINTYKQHIECRDACYSFQEYGSDCIGFGMLREEMHEAYGDTTQYDNVSEKEVRRKMGAHEIEMRNLLAAGIKASRLKPDQIAQYNSKHAHKRKEL